MNRRFRLKLFITMIVFALVIVFGVAFIDYLRLKEGAVDHYEFQLRKTEEEVNYALQTIDKAYHLFDQDTVDLLEEQSMELMALYEEEGDFDQWDFSALSESYGVDIYIIDEHSVITHSNREEEIGLDFSECCGTLNKILQERRAAGGFYVDAMDVEQNSGEIRRYSYMATKDKKYMIELGYSLEEESIFQQFNFLQTIEDLIERYPVILDIRVLNLGGLSFGADEYDLPRERRQAFSKTRSSKETTEIQAADGSTIYRYVYYVPSFDQGVARSKVLEITYDTSNFQALLKKQQRTFIMQLFIVLIVTILLSLLISRWMARPIHLAFHDSMTDLKNRAAFEEVLKDICASKEGESALIMLDIDNFKLVNDRLGHDQGDALLVQIAKVLKRDFGREAELFRVGGDEFAVILQRTSKAGAEDTARLLRERLVGIFQENRALEDLPLGVSIGIALTDQYGANPETLFKAADLALYHSKKSSRKKISFCQEEVI